jgi:glycosyltransferase involved in cell wall biosynthesis
MYGGKIKKPGRVTLPIPSAQSDLIPMLSIVMPLYNAAPFVGEAIQSILNQSFKDFELIIIDDGSTDNSLKIAQSFSDPRIRILKNDENKGIVYTRNRGLHEMKGRYFAPFDADDIAHPDKFSIQLEFMEKHPEFGLVGTWAYHIDPLGNRISSSYKLSGSPESIPIKMLFRAYFIQSAVVFRKEVLPPEGYTTGYDIAEDYKIYFDTAQKFKTWNIPRYLIEYRIHPQSSTHRERTLFKYNEKKVYEYIYKNLQIDITDSIFYCLQKIKSDKPILSSGDLIEIFKFLTLIRKQNLRLSMYPKGKLSIELLNRWLKACATADIHWIKKMIIFISLPVKQIFNLKL